MSKELLIGFIGQGFIGKNYANDFENRGYEVIRYAKEEPYIANSQKIKKCDIVFIAVPTPTTPDGFNYDILSEVIYLCGANKSVVIKSTILPGTCAALQKKYPDRYIFHSPEFLTEKTAAYDAAHPTRNIIGYAVDNEEYHKRAEEILAILPGSPLNMICSDKEAETIKYASNCFLYLKVVYANILFNLASKEGSDYEKIIAGMSADPRIGNSHLGINSEGGRGAGGNCFIKDFAAFTAYLEKTAGSSLDLDFFRIAEEKNIELLMKSKKDISLLESVYGQGVSERLKKHHK
jgi:UDPglucose 6-dehydrogenase